MPTPLVIGPAETDALAALIELAHANVVEIHEVLRLCATPAGKRKHMDQMNKQSVDIPVGFMVTFSVETGHPAGRCLHMSMSSAHAGRTPTPEAVWMIAELLGFRGSLKDCAIWEEELLRGPKRRMAINVVQPIPS